METGTKSLDTFYYKEDSDTVIEGYVPEDAIAPITIFGEDDRMFTSTWNLPFSAICYVVAYYPDGSRSMGSGFLVDDNVMVTCAHIAKGAISIDVMPGKFGDTDRFGKTWAKNVVTPTAYDVNNHTVTNDWAIVKLQDRIGQNTGWEGVVRYEDYNVLNNERIMTAGYPADQGSTICLRSYGYVSNTKEFTFEHNADIVVGQSGSPIFRASDNLVVGIQSSESDVANYASRAYNDFFYLLRDIINED